MIHIKLSWMKRNKTMQGVLFIVVTAAPVLIIFLKLIFVCVCLQQMWSCGTKVTHSLFFLNLSSQIVIFFTCV